MPSLREVERMRSQLEVVQAESRNQGKELKRLEVSIAESQMQEQRARFRAERERERYASQQQRLSNIEQRQSVLQDEVQKAEQRLQEQIHGKGSGAPGMGSPGQKERPGRQSRSSGFALPSSLPGDSSGLRSAGMQTLSRGGSSSSLAVPDAAAQVEVDGDPAAEASGSAWGTGLLEQLQAFGVDEDDQDPLETDERCRDVIRNLLVTKAGSAKAAFRVLDTNGSGHISLQEFADGVSRLGVPWEDITGLRRPRELFKLFDENGDHVIDFRELFPGMARDAARASTPEFWRRYCRSNGDVENLDRGPRWYPPSPEEKLKELFGCVHSLDEQAKERERMAAMHKRLKSRGKSDARCREIVFRHLPQGTGPKDRQDVSTLTVPEVQKLKKGYMDSVLETSRDVQKHLFDMREQRMALQNVRQQLRTVAPEPKVQPMTNGEEQLRVASGFAGLGNLLNKPKDKPAADIVSAE